MFTTWVHAQWRYDTINRMLVENYGNIDHNVARDIITFLSPDRTPGYWTDTLNASDPMSAIVEGHLVVADVKVRTFWSSLYYCACAHACLVYSERHLSSEGRLLERQVAASPATKLRVGMSIVSFVVLCLCGRSCQICDHSRCHAPAYCFHPTPSTCSSSGSAYASPSAGTVSRDQATTTSPSSTRRATEGALSRARLRGRGC